MKGTTVNYFEDNELCERFEERMRIWSYKADRSVKNSRTVRCLIKEILATYEECEEIKSDFSQYPFLTILYDSLREKYVEEWFKEYMRAHRDGILWLAYYKEKRKNMLKEYVFGYEQYLEKMGFCEVVRQLNEKTGLVEQNREMLEFIDGCRHGIKKLDTKFGKPIASGDDSGNE